MSKTLFNDPTVMNLVVQSLLGTDISTNSYAVTSNEWADGTVILYEITITVKANKAGIFICLFCSSRLRGFANFQNHLSRQHPSESKPRKIDNKRNIEQFSFEDGCSNVLQITNLLIPFRYFSVITKLETRKYAFDHIVNIHEKKVQCWYQRGITFLIPRRYCYKNETKKQKCEGLATYRVLLPTKLKLYESV
ncbi:hypothetical protein BDF21DRAFT_456097 [Thamnidium elegans]|nr:hypothetical protein BDF21DRAFT_456097 [Thamnidium elegans]